MASSLEDWSSKIPSVLHEILRPTIFLDTELGHHARFKEVSRAKQKTCVPGRRNRRLGSMVVKLAKEWYASYHENYH